MRFIRINFTTPNRVLISIHFYQVKELTNIFPRNYREAILTIAFKVQTSLIIVALGQQCKNPT